MVTTFSGTAAPITATRLHHLAPEDLLAQPHNAPIRVEVDAMPWLSLSQAQLFSPHQYVLWEDPLRPDCPCLLPLHSLCNGGTIRRVIPDDGMLYAALAFETPQLISADGLWVETGLLPHTDRRNARPKQVLVDDRRVFIPQ